MGFAEVGGSVVGVEAGRVAAEVGAEVGGDVGREVGGAVGAGVGICVAAGAAVVGVGAPGPDVDSCVAVGTDVATGVADGPGVLVAEPSVTNRPGGKADSRLDKLTAVESLSVIARLTGTPELTNDVTSIWAV
jgi:hypothetical protein